VASIRSNVKLLISGVQYPDINRFPAPASTLSRLVRRSISLVVAAGIATLAIGSATGAANRPVLRIVKERPLMLTGARFKAHEAVRVTVRTGRRTLTRDTRAGAQGGFTVTFRAKVNFCAWPLSIVARGPASGTATARLPRPVCASD
jgi:hypothetical protein